MATTMFVACSNDSDLDVSNHNTVASKTSTTATVSKDTATAENGVLISSKTKVIQFQDFVDGMTNVKHSADTTSIELNNQLLSKLNYYNKINTGDVLDIWEDVKCPPYVRLVTDVKDNGNGTTVVTTTRANFTMLFDELDVNLSTAPYYDASKRPTRATTRSGGTSEEDMVSAADAEQFRDGNTVHPMVVYTQNDDKTFTYSLTEKELEAAGTRGFLGWALNSVKMVVCPWTAVVQAAKQAWNVGSTVYDIFKNQEISYSNQVAKVDLNDLKKEVALDDYNKIGVKNGKVQAEFALNIYIKHNKGALQRFETYAQGIANINADMYFHSKYSKEFKQNVSLCDLPSKTFLMYIGKVPVTVEVAQNIEFKGRLKVNGKMDATLPIRGIYTCKVGPRFSNCRWSSLLEQNVQEMEVDYKNFKAEGEASAEAEAGVYYKLSANIYNMVGPYVQVGPYIHTNASVKANVKGDEGKYSSNFKFNFNGFYGIGCCVGAHIKTPWFDVKSWDGPQFDLVKKNMDLDSVDVSSSDLGKDLFQLVKKLNSSKQS